MKNLGKNIAQIRKHKRLTQVELAKEADINYRHFQKIEGDKTDIRISTANEIARVLDVPLHLLFNAKLNADILNQGIKCYSELLDKMPAGICLSDTNGRILFLNKYFTEHLSYHTQEAVDKRLHVWDLIPEDEKKQGQERVIQVVQKNLPNTPTVRTYVGPKNEHIKVLVLWDSLKDAEGTVKGFVSTVIPLDQIKGL